MNKRLKRVIWVVSLVLIFFILSYLIFACNNLRDRRVPWSELDGGMYLDQITEKELTLEGDRASLRVGEEIYQLTVQRFENGILIVGADAEQYVFSVQSSDRLYCRELNAYLFKS